MTVAEDLLHRHIATLLADNTRWQMMLADDVVWELPFAPALGHPARLSGRAEVVKFAAWFVGAVENFRFFDMRVQASADPELVFVEHDQRVPKPRHPPKHGTRTLRMADDRIRGDGPAMSSISQLSRRP